MKFIEFAVKRPIFGHLVTLFLIVGGIMAMLSLRREVFPETNLNLVLINTIYRNASPEEVEDLVTIPIEEEINDVEEIEEYTSISMEGISFVIVELDPELKNTDAIVFDIQRRVDRATLPENTEDPDIQALTTKDPVIKIYVAGGASEFKRRDYVEYLKTRILEIPDVSAVTKEGWRDEEFWVELNPEKLTKLELSISEVIEHLAQRNVNLPGGRLPENSQEIALRTIGKFHTEKEIENVIVRSNINGNYVQVKDVGTVRRNFEPNSVYAKMGGKDVILLQVTKKTRGDSIDVADAVKKLLKEEKERINGTFEVGFIDDFSFYVKRRLKVVVTNGLMGIVLVVFSLLVFLNLRVALFTAFGIPFAFLGALLIMMFYGVSINLMTMFGMIIVLGMIVDDAIIVGENIYRHLEEGMDQHQAALQGVLEVAKPVISTILTTIAAFLPLFFAPDIYGKFFSWLVVVVVATLGASLFECLIVLPSHASEFARPVAPSENSQNSHAFGHRFMKATVKHYGKFLQRCLRRRYVFLTMVAATFVGFVLLAKHSMRIDIFPADLIDVFNVKMVAEPGSSLETTDAIVAGLEKEIAKLPPEELENYVTIIGMQQGADGANQIQGTHLGQLFVYLTPQNTRARKTADIVDTFRSLNFTHPHLERIEFEMLKPGPPTGKELEVKIRGKDFSVSKKISRKIQEYMQTRPALKDINDDFLEGKDELHVLVDEPEAVRLGLSVSVIAQSVFATFEGAEATIVREGKEEIAVRVRLQEPWRSEKQSLSTLKIRNAANRLIKLSTVAQFVPRKGLPNINHFNGERVITVSANLDKKRTSSEKESKKLLETFKDLASTYPGYQIEISGEGKETEKIKNFMLKAFGIAMLIIYMILALQFNSFFQPLILLLSIPLGMMGVIMALMAHGKPVSMMAMMGMVGLAGVVVNDAIVLVSFVNDRRRSGMPIFDALFEAGRKRFRPIILTSITTVAGLFPVIYGWGGYEPFIAPAALTLAYGLMFATFLTLLVVPCAYYMFYDVKQFITGKHKARF